MQRKSNQTGTEVLQRSSQKLDGQQKGEMNQQADSRASRYWQASQTPMEFKAHRIGIGVCDIQFCYAIAFLFSFGSPSIAGRVGPVLDLPMY